MLTPFILKMVGIFLVFFLAGMLFGNIILLYLSFVPLFIVFFSLILDAPSEVKIVKGEQRLSTWVNEAVEISEKAEAEKGIGLISVADILPEHFELIDGNNFRVFWKGLGKLSEELRYRVKCTKRGIYYIRHSSESRHFSSFKQSQIDVGANDTELVVRTKPLNIKQMRDPKIVSKIPMPIGSVTKLGMLTTDFREIREYSLGDSYRHINWKATARLRGPLHLPPLVNEFEREGKKVVWIFLDASSSMAIGTNVENAFEYALQSVSGLAQFYLARNCHIGLYIYNDGGKLLLPDAGRRQEYKIAKEILGLEVSAADEPLKKAVENCRGHLLGTNPYSIIITVVRKENLQELMEGIKEIRRYSKGARKQPQILVIHIMSYSIAAKGFCENVSAVLLDMGTLPVIRALKRTGAFVIPWNPRRQSLMHLMVLGMKRK